MTRTGHPARRSALVAALLCAAALLFVLHWLPTAERHYGQLQPVQTGALVPQFDFFQYYASGHNWRLGLDPYRNYPGVHEAIVVPRGAGLSGYIYPPAFLPVLGLLSQASYAAARGIWLAVTLCALAVPLGTGVALAKGRRLLTLALGILLVTASDPLLFHIRQGQIDVLVAGFAVTGFLLYGRLRSVPAAVLLAAAVLLKVTPVVLVFAMVAYYRDWWFLAKTLVAVAALAAVSLVAVDPHLYVEYVVRVMPTVSEGNPFFHNQSLLRSWSHVGGLLKYASLCAYALIVAFAAAVGKGARREPSPGRAPLAGPDLQLLALVTTAVLLFSPLSWRMAYAGAVVPMTLVLAATPWDGTRWQYACVAAGTALMCLPLWDHPVLDSLETIGAAVAGAGLLMALAVPALPRGLRAKGAPS